MMQIWKKMMTAILLCMLLVAPVTVGATENAISDTEVVDTEITITEAEKSDAVNAAEGYVYDYAGLMSDEEITELEIQIADMKEKNGWDIFAVTTDYAEGKSSTAYADDFYDQNLFGYNEVHGNAVLVELH